MLGIKEFVKSNGGQRKTAKLLGCSHSYLSEVCAGKKKGTKVFNQLDIFFSNNFVMCPLFGDITHKECTNNQNKPLTNSFNAKIKSTCATCMQKWRINNEEM